MRWKFLLFILLLTIPIVFAEIEPDDSWVYNSKYLVLQTNISSSIQLTKGSNDAELDSLTANISFFPKEGSLQEIIRKQITPRAAEHPDSLFFEWKNPMINTLDFSMNYQIRNTNNPIRVTKKIKFPLETIPNEAKDYLKAGEIIDINDDIIALASSLAEGEDDAVIVVDKIAKWTTQNIKYNLSTVTSEATQKASWVLENRNGVCDELTSLFISMLRSLDIPARFVSGISYTNSELFQDKWGPHGWAEVYFPDYGWIPYDVTYGEYGFVDPTHIVTGRTIDAEKITTQYAWKGRDTKVKVNPLKTDVKVLKYGEQITPRITIEQNQLKGSVGFGSYNIIEATVKNLANFYQPIDVFISKTTMMEVLGEHKQHIMLRPYEEQQILWLVKVEDDLEEDYIYNFPVMVYTIGNASDKKIFHAINGGYIVTQDKARSEMEQLRTEKEKIVEKDIDMKCGLDKEEYYEYEKPQVSCIIKNVGNALIKDLKICYDSKCKETDIGITQEYEVKYEHEIREKHSDITITAESDLIKKRMILNFLLLDKPEIEITDLEFPRNVSYDENYLVSFILKKKSYSNPYSVKVNFRIGDLSTDMGLMQMDEDQLFEIELKGMDLEPDNNEIRIDADYEDKYGKQYSTSEKAYISLEKLTFLQKMDRLFSNVGHAIASIFE